MLYSRRCAKIAEKLLKTGEEKHEKVKNMLMLEEEFWKQFGKDIDSKDLTVSTLCFDNLALKEYSLI